MRSFREGPANDRLQACRRAEQAAEQAVKTAEDGYAGVAFRKGDASHQSPFEERHSWLDVEVARGSLDRCRLLTRAALDRCERPESYPMERR